MMQTSVCGKEETRVAVSNAEHPGDKPASSNTVPVILLTGQPGIGKTTAIQHVVNVLGDRVGGFYTRDSSTGSTGSRNNDISTPSLSTGTWQHVALVYSTSESLKAVYVDVERLCAAWIVEGD